MTKRTLRVTAFVLFALLAPAIFGAAAQASPLFQDSPPAPFVGKSAVAATGTATATTTATVPATITATATATGTIATTPRPPGTVTATLTVTPTVMLGRAAVYMPAILNVPPGAGTPTPSGTPSPSLTPTGTITATTTPPGTTTPTGTLTGTPTGTGTPSPSATPTGTPTGTVSPTPDLGDDVLLPFDGNVSDLSGPADWASNYGKSPELIAAANGMELDVLAQDYDPATVQDAVLLHIAKGPDGYAVTEARTDLPMLDRVMGLAVDEDGNRYYATAVDENARVNSTYPPANTYRSDIVQVVKVDPTGQVLFNIDLDPARHAADSGAEMIINPMVAASARLAVGGGEVALVHGINTGPDWNIGGQRHQKALSTRMNAADGSVLATSTIWVSHSFDQRLLYDGSGIVEFHLGDAYPRHLTFGRSGRAYPLFYIKGPLGENLTATRLGDLARIQNDPVYGYLALFATENTTALGSLGDPIAGPRNLAIVRVNKSDNSVDPGLPNTLAVTSSGVARTNKLRWLTSYTLASGLHAERPKLVPLGGDRYVVLWEQWYAGGQGDEFQGVYGLAIDAQGNTLASARLLTDQHHLPRGDDAFLLDGKAGWLTGDAGGPRLDLHLVDAGLSYQREPIALP